MDGEKARLASNSPDELGSSVEKEVNSAEDMSESHQSFQNPTSTMAQDASGFNFESGDTTLDHWALNKQFHSMLKDFKEHNLPLTSSRSSIMWKDLLVRGAGTNVTYQQTVGQILRGPLTTIQNLRLRNNPQERVILRGLEGVVWEGEMLLVLGRPGSGCSTFLKTLCGLTDEYLGWQGGVKYNGVDIKTFKRRFRGDAVYTPEGKNFIFESRTSTNVAQLTFISPTSKSVIP
jgi:ATP-binding cassette, subfamily G (WHITE), member 2, PDR